MVLEGWVHKKSSAALWSTLPWSKHGAGECEAEFYVFVHDIVIETSLGAPARLDLPRSDLYRLR